MIDMMTLMITYFSISVIDTLLTYIYWRNNRSYEKASFYWFLAMSAQTICFLLIALNSVLPDFFSILVANTLLAAAAVLILIGTSKILEFKIKYRLNYILLAGWFITFSLFTYAFPAESIRIIVLSVFVLGMFLQTGYHLFRKNASVMLEHRLPMGIATLLYCLVQIYRIVIALIFPSQQSLLHTEFDLIGQLMTLVLLQGMIFAFFVMINGKTMKKMIKAQREIEKVKTIQEVTQKSERKYRLLFNELPLGFATHQFIFDKFNTPIDYIFLSSNAEYEKHTGLKNQDIIGKAASVIYADSYDTWINKYVQMMKQGGRISFNEYSVQLGKYFFITAYTIEKDQFATIIQDVSELIKKDSEIEFLYSYDPLTKLRNRSTLIKDLLALDGATKLDITLMLMDINGFKLYNDAYGYATGDEVLKSVANIVVEISKDIGTPYRFGSDEFGILFNNISESKAKKIKQDILDRTSQIVLNDMHLSLTVEFGHRNTQELSIFDFIGKIEAQINTDKIYEERSHRSSAIRAILATLTAKYAREKIHSERVSVYCGKLAIKLGFDTSTISRLKLSGLLHDIGKITIPDAILDIPGKLTKEQFEVIKTHVESGYKILRSADEYTPIANDALHHHERYDGLGYPSGLKGEEIPVSCRIINIADSYEAMTSDRVYRNAMTVEEAINELSSCKGKQFDPMLVDKFIEILKEEQME